MLWSNHAGEASLPQVFRLQLVVMIGSYRLVAPYGGHSCSERGLTQPLGALGREEDP